MSFLSSLFFQGYPYRKFIWGFIANEKSIRIAKVTLNVDGSYSWACTHENKFLKQKVDINGNEIMEAAEGLNLLYSLMSLETAELGIFPTYNFDGKPVYTDSFLGSGSDVHAYKVCLKSSPNEKFVMKLFSSKGETIKNEQFENELKLMQYLEKESDPELKKRVATLKGFNEESQIIFVNEVGLHFHRNEGYKPNFVVMFELATALLLAHRIGIIHRDIKLSNIFIDEATRMVILDDFGIAVNHPVHAIPAAGEKILFSSFIMFSASITFFSFLNIIHYNHILYQVPCYLCPMKSTMHTTNPK